MPNHGATPSRGLGYFSDKRFGSRDGNQIHDEIALNIRHFQQRSPRDILSTMVYEMVHLSSFISASRRGAATQQGIGPGISQKSAEYARKIHVPWLRRWIKNILYHNDATANCALADYGVAAKLNIVPCRSWSPKALLPSDETPKSYHQTGPQKGADRDRDLVNPVAPQAIRVSKMGEPKLMGELTHAEPNHAFWQKLILPEEERDLPWDEKGYRWFKSPNIVQLERYRGRRLPRMEPDAAA